MSDKNLSRGPEPYGSDTRKPLGGVAPGQDSVAKGEERLPVYTVHERLMSEATGPLVRNGLVHAEEGTNDLQRRLQRILQQATQEAYVRGVRDGYVQAVAEASE